MGTAYISKNINQVSDTLIRWWIASFVVSYYCIARSLSSNIFLSHSANWSADAHLCGSGYALLSDKRPSILGLILCQSHFKSLLDSITDRRHVCRSKLL